jgi:hypothetical protein
VQFWFVCSFGKKHEKKWENTKGKKGEEEESGGGMKNI